MQSTMISAAPVSVYPPSNRKRTREYSDEEHDKKRSHRMVEQRRRERMNGLIDELSALIPLSFLTAQPNRTRPNILTAAISYLEAAQKVLSAVEGASSLSLTRRQINDSSSNAHFNIDSMISAHHGHGADSGSAVAMAQHHQDAVHAASEQSVAMAAAKTSFHVHHGSVSSSPAAALAQHHHQHHHHHPHHHDGGMGVSQMPLTLNGSSTGCVNLSNIEASGVTIMAQAAHHASQVQVGSERAARTRSTGTRRSTTPTTSPRTTSARTSPTAAILHTNTSSISHPSNAPSASAAIINRNSSSSSASHMSAVSQHSTAHHSVASPHHHDQQSAMSAIMEMLHSSSPHRSPVASSPSSSSSATTSPHHHHFYPHLPEPVSVVPIDHHDDMAATSLRELESLATATTAPLNSTATTATTTTSAAGATTTATSTVCGAAAAAAALASSFPEANESENNNLNAHATVTVEPSHYLHHGVSIDELTMYS